jgi:hypothetical protein
MLSSYNETLDFFSPEGVPLRATLALTFKQDNYQFDIIDLKAALGRQGRLAVDGAGVSAADANLAANRDPKQWRDTALYNGMENPRHSDNQGVVIPPTGGNSGGGSVGGFSYGQSDKLGTQIPGAF